MQTLLFDYEALCYAKSST